MTDSRLQPSSIELPPSKAEPPAGRTRSLWIRPVLAFSAILLVLAGTWVYLQARTTPAPQGLVTDTIGTGIGLEVAFDLLDHQGQPKALADFGGTPLLVVFGYTHCPDVCPTTLSRVATAMDAMEAEGAEIQGAFITVDPARDTPEVLASYVDAFHPRMIGLTGDDSSLQEATQSFRVFAQKVGDEAQDYFVDHSAYVYLINAGGDLLSYYHPDLDAETLLADIRSRLEGSL